MSFCWQTRLPVCLVINSAADEHPLDRLDCPKSGRQLKGILHLFKSLASRNRERNDRNRNVLSLSTLKKINVLIEKPLSKDPELLELPDLSISTHEYSLLYRLSSLNNISACSVTPGVRIAIARALPALGGVDTKQCE